MAQDLTLRLDNPYSTGEIMTFDEGDSLLDRQPIQYTKSIRDRYFTTTQDDTLDSISFEAYASSKWYWLMWDCNEFEEFPFDLTPGTSLLVPDLEKIKTTNL